MSGLPKLLDKMKTMPELRDASTDQQENGLEARLVVDRDTASRLGLTMQDVDNVLYDAFGQRQVSTMYTGLNQYYVVMEVDPKYQRDPDSLRNIYLRSSSGTNVPLSAISHFESRRTALAVNHSGQYPVHHAYFQSRAEHSPRSGRHRAQQSEAADGHAQHRPGRLLRHGAGLPVLARE